MCVVVITIITIKIMYLINYGKNTGIVLLVFVNISLSTNCIPAVSLYLVTALGIIIFVKMTMPKK